MVVAFALMVRCVEAYSEKKMLLVRNHKTHGGLSKVVVYHVHNCVEIRKKS